MTTDTAFAPQTAGAYAFEMAETRPAGDVEAKVIKLRRPFDWSNVVFSVAFCEQARRDYEVAYRELT
ncbi:MAG: hypothetical protein AAF360_11345 [Pseudomonadota bacterium]